ncbi:uncharacterized protein DDB_G0271670-like [Abrus precatorius]|uniref:Uncharacterized protein DDB_G0271670-like n=1 Tax=Abrus precatorius TaxID=3816 RepID=A0A8B8JV31_ABRPR|nr:uncharacterized protein DDB_G0271670-like [Abrus precatorius]
MAVSTPVRPTSDQPSTQSAEVSIDDTPSVNSTPRVQQESKKRLTPIPEESQKSSKKNREVVSQNLALGNEATSSSSSGTSSSSSDASSSSSSSSSEHQAQTEQASEVPPISRQTPPLGSPEVDVVTYHSEEEGPLHEGEENVAAEGNQVPENLPISVEGPPSLEVVPPASSINSEMNLDDFNAMVEEDPEGAIDKILAGTFTFSSSSHTPSGSHSEISKPTESTEKMLEDLRSLVFYAPMMKNLPTDKDLVAKVKGLLSSLKVQLSTFPEGLQRFESLFIDSLPIIDQTTVVGSKQDQARVKQDSASNKLKAARTGLVKLKESATNADMKQKEVDARIVDLEKQLERARKESKMLKKASEACEKKRKNFIENVKTLTIERAQAMEDISSLDAQCTALETRYQNLRAVYTEMRSKPPF